MAVGVEAIPIVSLITFFVGLIMALQSAYRAAADWERCSLWPRPWRISILRELGPLLTAIVVIGRSGSAFAAEIGTKKVTEEVDALRTMAFDPVAFLVAPKFLAMLVMMPCLTIWADFMGIVGGSVFGVTGANFTFGSYFQATRDAIVLRDIYTGLIKSVLFGSGHYGCRMQGRLLDRGGRRGGWTLDDGGRRHLDRTGDCGRSGVYSFVLCY